MSYPPGWRPEPGHPIRFDPAELDSIAAPAPSSPVAKPEQAALNLDLLAELPLVDPAWGIDPSTERMALTILLPGGQWDVGCIPVPQPGDEATRIYLVQGRLRDWFTAQIEDHGLPGVASVEQPFAFGRNVHPQSYYMLACVLGALRAAGVECPIFTRGPGQWKAGGIGKGHGTDRKPAILEWARGLGLPDNCPKCHGVSLGKKHNCDKSHEAHDKADSLGVAVDAARLLLA